MRVPSAISAKIASGFEFSPHIRPDAGPNSVANAPNVSPCPPVCTSRSPTVGMIFWCLRIRLPSGPIYSCVLNRVPSVFGSFSQTPVSYTHLRAHETGRNLVCRLLLEKKKRKHATKTKKKIKKKTKHKTKSKYRQQ